MFKPLLIAIFVLIASTSAYANAILNYVGPISQVYVHPDYISVHLPQNLSGGSLSCIGGANPLPNILIIPKDYPMAEAMYDTLLTAKATDHKVFIRLRYSDPHGQHSCRSYSLPGDPNVYSAVMVYVVALDAPTQ